MRHEPHDGSEDAEQHHSLPRVPVLHARQCSITRWLSAATGTRTTHSFPASPHRPCARVLHRTERGMPSSLPFRRNQSLGELVGDCVGMRRGAPARSSTYNGAPASDPLCPSGGVPHGFSKLMPIGGVQTTTHRFAASRPGSRRSVPTYRGDNARDAEDRLAHRRHPTRASVNVPDVPGGAQTLRMCQISGVVVAGVHRPVCARTVGERPAQRGGFLAACVAAWGAVVSYEAEASTRRRAEGISDAIHVPRAYGECTGASPVTQPLPLAILAGTCGDRAFSSMVLDDRGRRVVVVRFDQLNVAHGPQMDRTHMEHNPGGASVTPTRKHDADRHRRRSLHVLPTLPARVSLSPTPGASGSARRGLWLMLSAP